MPIPGRAPGIDELGAAIEAGVFPIDIETCSPCGSAVRVIPCIEDPVVIGKILTHLDKKGALNEPGVLPRSRAPPPAGLFG